jgi:hypothetical protein
MDAGNTEIWPRGRRAGGAQKLLDFVRPLLIELARDADVPTSVLVRFLAAVVEPWEDK